LSIDTLNIDTKARPAGFPVLEDHWRNSVAVETFSIAAVNSIKAGVTMIPYAGATFVRAGEPRIARQEERPARRHRRSATDSRKGNGAALLVHRTQRGSSHAKSKNRF
jgi:hypothetical protein